SSRSTSTGWRAWTDRRSELAGVVPGRARRRAVDRPALVLRQRLRGIGRIPTGQHVTDALPLLLAARGQSCGGDVRLVEAAAAGGAGAPGTGSPGPRRPCRSVRGAARPGPAAVRRPREPAHVRRGLGTLFAHVGAATRGRAPPATTAAGGAWNPRGHADVA